MAKKQTIVKNPVGNGNISITIENNLKNTNPPPPPAKRRRRRKQLPTTDETNSMIENMLRGGSATGGGGGLPPLKDVSYIKPGPINNFAVWRDNFNDSYNTTIPQGQAQQMGMLPLPKVEAPPTQLALTAPPAADTPLTMREFAMIMMQQGKNGARPGYQNLHEDLYNGDEPMEDRYANLRPSSRIEEVESDVLKEVGATEEQINNYQQQIQQHKAINTTNEQKLASVGLDPKIIQNIKKIAAIKTAGTWQGKRNIKPDGLHIKDPNFIASYNAARADRLSKEPSERETAINRNKKYTLLGEGEDPWDNLDAAPAPGEEEDENIIELAAGSPNFGDLNSEFITVRKRGGRSRGGRSRDEGIQQEDEEMKIAEQQSLLELIVKGEDSNALKREQLKTIKEQIKEIDDAIAAHKKKKGIKGKKELDEEKEMREILFRAGLRKDTKTNEERQKEKEAATTLSKAFKENKARKEMRKLFEEARMDKIDADNREIKKQKEQAEEQAGKVITKYAQRYKEKKAWVKKAKADLEAEIASLQEEMQGIRQPNLATSKAISKALESIKDFWKDDTTKEEARQARKDVRQAKKDAQKETEDKLSAKSKALQERRKLLETLGK